MSQKNLPSTNMSIEELLHDLKPVIPEQFFGDVELRIRTYEKLNSTQSEKVFTIQDEESMRTINVKVSKGSWGINIHPEGYSTFDDCAPISLDFFSGGHNSPEDNLHILVWDNINEDPSHKISLKDSKSQNGDLLFKSENNEVEEPNILIPFEIDNKDIQSISAYIKEVLSASLIDFEWVSPKNSYALGIEKPEDINIKDNIRCYVAAGSNEGYIVYFEGYGYNEGVVDGKHTKLPYVYDILTAKTFDFSAANNLVLLGSMLIDGKLPRSQAYLFNSKNEAINANVKPGK